LDHLSSLPNLASENISAALSLHRHQQNQFWARRYRFLQTGNGWADMRNGFTAVACSSAFLREAFDYATSFANLSKYLSIAG
jgi:hypothetical protein